MRITNSIILYYLLYYIDNIYIIVNRLLLYRQYRYNIKLANKKYIILYYIDYIERVSL